MPYKNKKIAKEKNKFFLREHYKRNKSYYKNRNTVRKNDRRKKKLDYLLAHPCVDCGEADPVVLDFDHVRGTKVSDISSLLKSGKHWDIIYEEIQKCDVRCANCHRKVTAKRRYRNQQNAV